MFDEICRAEGNSTVLMLLHCHKAAMVNFACSNLGTRVEL